MIKLASRFEHLRTIERKRIVTAPNVVLRLNRGERPESHPTDLKDLIVRETVVEGDIRRYPSFPAFYERLAGFVGVPVERLCVGAGIEEFIKTLMLICVEHGDGRAAVLYPTCAMYDIYAQAFDVPMRRIATDRNWSMTADQLCEELFPSMDKRHTTVMFLPNPGQPVETYYGLIELAKIATACQQRGCILAIDEAHHGFGSESALPLVDYFDNVVIMRTFSKAMGAAGIRVGYTIAQEALTKSLHGIRPSGEITGPSMRIATVLMDNFRQHVAPVILETINGREWARDEINAIKDLKAHGKWGFSLLIEFYKDGSASAESCRAAVDFLSEQGTYVKGGFEYPIDHCILVACGGRPMMAKFVEQLRVAATDARIFTDGGGVREEWTGREAASRR